MRCRIDSGSRRSPSSVEPTRSEKTTVTVLRTSRSPAAVIAAPQARQNFAPLGFSWPHCGQTAIRPLCWLIGRRGPSGGAGEIRTRERGTPVTAFPVRTDETASFGRLRVAELQFELSLTSAHYQLTLNGPLFLEMPWPRARQCRDLSRLFAPSSSRSSWARAD